MVKRMSFLICLMLITVFVVSCAVFSERSTTVSPILEAESQRILELIPEEFSEDIMLPGTLSSDIDVAYRIDGETLNEPMISYVARDHHSEIELEIVLDHDGDSHLFYVTLLQLRDETLYEKTQREDHIEYVFNEISELLPEELTSNVTLPDLNLDGTEISYTSDCGEIVRDRLQYDFPSEDTECKIAARVTYEGLTKTRDFDIRMLAYHKLPRLPELHIETEHSTEITSKEYYVPGKLSLVKNDDLPYPDIDDAGLQIRLRGNSTLEMPKKSFKIKFNRKTQLLSDYDQKDWVLLANYSDQTLIRNHLAFEMARNLGMEFAPCSSYVDVYLNGEFLGNYQLTDQVEVTDHRVDVEEKSTDIDTGYLIEFDKGLFRTETDENHFMLYGIPFAIKSPDSDDDHYRHDHLEFIKAYMTNVYNTLQAQEDYSALIDDESFIDWFIVNEVFKNVDSGYSSVFFYKDKGGKLKMGPVWDFDLSAGNPGHLGNDLRGPEGWYTSRHEKNIFFHYLMRYPSFREKLKTRWNEMFDDAIISVLEDIFSTADAMSYSRYCNFHFWDVIGKNNEWYTAPEILAIDTYEGQLWFLHDYLEERIRWLDQAINNL